MKKKFLFYSFCFIISLVSYGQSKTNEINIKWSNEEVKLKDTELTEIIGFAESGFYILRKSNSINPYVLIEHYGTDLIKKREYSISLNNNSLKMKYEFTLYLDSTFYVFSSALKKNDNKLTQLFVQTLNERTLMSNNDIRLIAEINNLNNSGLVENIFKYKFSNDSSKVLIYYDLLYKKGESKKIGFHVFDKSINDLWSKEITMPNLNKYIYLSDYLIDNDGNAYLLAKVYDNQEKKEMTNYNYKVIASNGREPDFTIYDIEVEGKFLSEMKFTIGNDNNLVCVGLYSEKCISRSLGCYFLKIDKNSKGFITQTFTKFDNDFVFKYIYDWELEKFNKNVKVEKFDETFKLLFQDIIVKEDGGFIVIVEPFYTEMESSYTKTASNTVYSGYYSSYRYLDIVSLNMTSNGEIIWNKGILKFQVTSNDRGVYSSYSFSNTTNNLYFIFNDNIDNLNKKKFNIKYGYTGNNKYSYVALVSMNMNGFQERHSLFTYKESGIIFKPNFCKQISGDQILLIGIKKNKYKFALITIN
jgi:hypothetical protein